MTSIRELFHALGNKHHLVVIGCSATKDAVKECLEEKELSEKLKNNLLEILKNLERIINDAQEAGKLADTLREKIYEVVDPNTGKPRVT